MIEVLEQVLEALEDVGVLTDREWQAVHKNKANELRQAIRERALYEVQRLGQEIEQEPVAWREVIKDLSDKYARAVVEFAKNIEKGAHSMSPIAREAGDLLLALHTAIDAAPPERTKIEFYHPPQRTWVGLTDEERLNFLNKLLDYGAGFVSPLDAVVRAIEAKLKEKNND
jgi:hypothetical protein